MCISVSWAGLCCQDRQLERACGSGWHSSPCCNTTSQAQPEPVPIKTQPAGSAWLRHQRSPAQVHSPASPAGKPSPSTNPGTAAHTKHQKPAQEPLADKSLPPSHATLSIPRAEEPRAKAVGCVRSLTIMFSRAYLASQQFRNTGMNKFRKGGQNIYESKSYLQKKIHVLYQKKLQTANLTPARKDPSPSTGLRRGCHWKGPHSPCCSGAAEGGMATLQRKSLC